LYVFACIICICICMHVLICICMYMHVCIYIYASMPFIFYIYVIFSMYMSSCCSSVAHTVTYDDAHWFSNPNYHKGILFQKKIPFARKIHVALDPTFCVLTIGDAHWHVVWQLLLNHFKTRRLQQMNIKSLLAHEMVVCPAVMTACTPFPQSRVPACIEIQ
jgi:hypothetical protein